MALKYLVSYCNFSWTNISSPSTRRSGSTLASLFPTAETLQPSVRISSVLRRNSHPLCLAHRRLRAFRSRVCYGLRFVRDYLMPRFEYRDVGPTPEAQQAFLDWIEYLDSEFKDPDPGHRSDVVRDALHQIYLGRTAGAVEGTLAQQTLLHTFDPRNATLEPEYYGDVDAAKYAERKPLIWFWMMYDRSPVGLNHWLGFRMRAMLARYVFKHCSKNVKLFHGIEVTFG